jgi:uncharacterized protein DUF2637
MKKSQKITYGWVVVALAVFAGVLTIALTGVAFWLSYEHLHDVAGAHGLVRTSARSWAWPATLDTFIVIGELLVLRASLLGRTDKFAVFLAAVGSAGSITLNVVGVGEDAGFLDYVVAGVPPVAALLAFAALMRQVHGAVKRYLAGTRVSRPETTPSVPEARPSVPAPQRPTQAPSQPAETPVVPLRPTNPVPGEPQKLPARRPRASQGLVPPAPDETAELLTTSQAAGLAGVPASTIRTWKARGKGGRKLVPVVEDPDVLYSRESVLQFIGAKK